MPDAEAKFAALIPHLRALRDGRCSLTEQAIAEQPDPELRGALRDILAIHKQRQAEARPRHWTEQLADKSEFIQAILDTDPNLIYVLDRRGRFVLANRAVTALFGVSLAQLREIDDEQVIADPHELESYRSVDRRVLNTGEAVTVEDKMTLPDGEVLWFQTYKMPLTRPDGEVYVLGISVNITERKRREMELARFAALVNSSVDAICSTDNEGTIVFWNRAAEHLLGYEKREIIGRNFLTLIPPGFEEQARSVIARLRSGQPIAPFETERRHKDGSTRAVLLSVSPVQLPDGTNVGTAAIMRDVTRRKQFEAELLAAKEQAEAAAIAKAQFLATMSHEIRTPLNGIIGVLGLLSSTELSEEQRELVDTIQVSGDTLLSLINDILDFSKMESAELWIEARPFDLVECVARVIKTSSVLASEKRLDLSASVDHTLPDRVIGDPTRLSQILGNLVSNAVKFTERGAVVVSVTQVARSGDDLEIEFSVGDTGIGIAADQIDYLFERFTQADASTTRRYGGTGLGLAISKRLIDLMGGAIWVESERGAGSTFRFRIPSTAADSSSRDPREADAAHIQELGDVEPTTLVRHDLAILVAEDNRINQKVALRLLHELGCSADLASDGVEVIAALDQRAYDFVLMDLHMPRMDGFTAAQQIIDDWPAHRRPVIIAMTADAMHGDRERCLTAGMHDYLSKPITLQALRAALVRWLNALPSTADHAE